MIHKIAFAAACLAATAAVAAPAANGETRKPDWLKKPNANQLQAVWPLAAVEQSLGGRAVIRCMVTTTGTLSDCVVVEDKPKGLGFGQAALLLAPSFLMRPAMVDGKAVESSVTIPINFEGSSVPSRRFDITNPVMGGRRMAVNLIWDETPSPRDVAAAWPAKAGDAAFGHVVLRCGVAKDGRLKSCSKISEEPAGRGFQDAARTLVPLFRLRTAGVEMKDLGTIDINLPIHLVSPAAPAEARMLPKPEWTRLPAPDQAMKLFPAQAAEAGLKTGRAVVECTVAKAGALTACSVIEETPTGMGFGQSAVALASALAVNPWTFEGLPAEGARVRAPVRINSREAKPAPGS